MDSRYLDSPVSTNSLLDFVISAELERLRTVYLTSDGLSATAPSLPYDDTKVFTYAQTYCGGGNDCPDGNGGSFELDCTHFICHCLAATGVQVTDPTAKCSKGLCIRVNDLAAAISNSVKKYSNVKQLKQHSDTKKGDLCFIPSWFGLRKEHAMLLAGTATAQGAKVYAHTNNRCGTDVVFEGAECVYYRIENAK